MERYKFFTPQEKVSNNEIRLEMYKKYPELIPLSLTTISHYRKIYLNQKYKKIRFITENSNKSIP